MLQRPPRVAAIHDLSGFGRCSLSVILPTLSAMKVQVCPIVTAVLSTHTGGLGEVVFRDLTDYLAPTLSHYQQLGLEFECVYSGFLGSLEQIDHCLEYYAAYPDALAVVDPVMGDHGRPYRTYTPEMCRRMGELAAVADLITPNLTEACILLGIPYPTSPLRQFEVKSILARLSELGPRYVALTGVSFEKGRLGVMYYDREKNEYGSYFAEHLPASFHGTGDVFASTCVGALMRGLSLGDALALAADYTVECIRLTLASPEAKWYGVEFESAIPYLVGRLS